MTQNTSSAALSRDPAPPVNDRSVRDQLAFWITLAYLWVVLLLLGAVVLETVLIYPNVFAVHRPRWP